MTHDFEKVCNETIQSKRLKFSDRVYSLKPFYHCRRARLTILFTSSHLNQNDDDIQRAFHIISLICLLENGTW